MGWYERNGPAQNGGKEQAVITIAEDDLQQTSG